MLEGLNRHGGSREKRASHGDGTLSARAWYGIQAVTLRKSIGCHGIRNNKEEMATAKGFLASEIQFWVR